jgi:hypothetical protein
MTSLLWTPPTTAFHQLTALVLAAKRSPRRRRYCGQEWPLRECEMSSRQMKRRWMRGERVRRHVR